MNIILINPATERYTRTPCAPLGILSIASYLESKGHKVKVLNRAVSSTNINSEYDSFRPDFIGCSLLSTMSFKDAIFVSKEAQKRNITVVWGGPFVASVPELTLDLGCIDYLSLGEGEETWLELAEAKQEGKPLTDIKGLAYLDESGKIVFTPEREFTDLSILPPINYEFIDIEKTLERRYDYDRSVALYISKGCNGHCTFCYNTAFHKNCRRSRPVKYLIQEAKELKEKHGINAITFSDEFFGYNKQVVTETCNAFIEEKLDMCWGCLTKIGVFDREDFQLMYDAGCRWIEFGVESGSPAVLRKMKKGLALDRVETDINICKEIGIVSLCYFIVGFPDETEEDLLQTCDLIKKLGDTRIICSYYNPLPGSEVFEKLVAEGKFTPPGEIKDYMKTKIFYSPKPNLSNVKTKDLKVVRSYFLWKSFSKKLYNKKNKVAYPLAKNEISVIIKSFFGHGLKAGLYQFFISGYEFLDIFFYANFFPKTKKKYGLNKK